MKSDLQTLPLEAERLYTGPFLLLCVSHALFSASFNMLIPELPAYLSSLGGEDYKGLIIGLFTLMAGISRPFSGKLTDTIGRVPVMVFGTLVCVLCSALYPLFTTVFSFLLLRFLHGFSTGFKPTASTAFAADIVPAHRRGEAMGIMGVSMNLGASISPPLGSYITQVWSLNAMFFASSFAALLSVLILINMKETLKERQPFRWSLLRISRHEILDWSAMPPAIVAVFAYASYGVLLTIVPDQSEHLGMSNKGMFFTSFTLLSVASRLVAGKASDRYGREPVMIIGGVAVAIGLVSLGLVETPNGLLIAAGVLGFAAGINSPAVFAWAIDRADPGNRGKALATTYIALEIGIGGGAMLSAAIYANEPSNFPITFFCFAGITLLAPLYLIIRGVVLSRRG